MASTDSSLAHARDPELERLLDDLARHVPAGAESASVRDLIARIRSRVAELLSSRREPAPGKGEPAAEPGLLASEPRFREIFDALDEGFCLIEVLFDEQGRAVDYVFLEANAAFEKQAGLTNVVGRRVHELVPDLDEHWFEIYGRVAFTGESVRFEDHAGALDRWFDVCAFRVGRPEQRQVAVLFNDMSERKRAEAALAAAHEQLAEHARDLEKIVAERTARLQETVRELEAFSYSLSHDLRAPLRTMKGFAEIVATQFAEQLGPEGQDYVKRISHSAARLDQLILDVLAYTRLVRADVQVRPVDLDRLVHQLIAEHPVLQLPRAEVTVQSPLHPVLGHEASLIQVLSNLLHNAVKFVAPGQRPRVRIWTEEASPEVRLFVQDEGIGFPVEARQRIFGMFQRFHSEQGYEGTGIGLALIRKAVERMGGSVDVASEPGKGSTFTVRLRKP